MVYSPIMDMRLAVILFITAHALGSYYFPERVRDGSVWGLLSSFVFYALSILLIFAAALDQILFLYALTLLLFHILVDIPFYFMRRRWSEGTSYRILFFSEEVLHGAFLTFIAFIYSTRWSSPTPWRSVRTFLNQASLDYSQVLSALCLFLLILLPAGKVIRMCLPERREEKIPLSAASGCAERVMYSICLYMGSVPAFAIVFLVKSLIYTPCMVKSGEKVNRVLITSVLSALFVFALFGLVSPFIHY